MWQFRVFTVLLYFEKLGGEIILSQPDRTVSEGK